MSDLPEARFRGLYAEHFRELLAFALRRTACPEDAADVVADTFLVAWRRLDRVPADDEARLWLYGVCRRVLANTDRSAVRRTRLGARLRTALAEQAVPDPAEDVALTMSVRDALARLRPADRELLQLAGWEGLEARELAVVLRIPARTARTRLSRARARLRAELGGDEPHRTGHVPHDRPAAPPLHPGLAREEDR